MLNKQFQTAKQKEILLPPELSREISEIYQAMQEGYEKVAEDIILTCKDCLDNCCDSYFQHHTFSEWAYLWEGLRQLDGETLDSITERAKEYVRQSADVLAIGKRPQLMCPLNEDGLCALYQHRMLICRMHGIPATLTRPDGQSMRFPGCFRCQQIVGNNYEQETDAPAMDRTLLFRRLAALESRLMGDRRHLYPRVKKTIADMIVEGPPAIGTPHCER
jgi:Fe-S-cluster containining protein